MPLTVATTTVRTGDVTEWLFAEGVAQAARKEFLWFRTPGRVVAIAEDATGLPLRAGSRVEAGEVIARLDDRDAETDLERIRADAAAARERLAATTAGARQAGEELARQRRLSERGVAARAAMEAAEAGFDEAEARRLEARAGLGAAEAGVEAAALALERTALTAPWGGVIAAMNLRVGDDAGGGGGAASDADQEAAAAVVLIDDAAFEVTLHLPPYDADRVAEGQRALIGASGTAIAAHARGEPGAAPVAEGTVWSVSPSISLQRRAVTVKLRAEGTEGVLRDGAFVSAWIAVAEAHGATLAPHDGVIQRGDDLHAYVAAGDAAERRGIVPGVAGLDALQVVDGLSPGEALVVRGQHRLSDGAPVRVVEE